MKSKVSKYIGASIIFFLIVFTIISVVRPVYKKINATISSYEQIVLNKITDITGLSVSYKSLSPSIFSGINLNRVVFYDSETKKEVLSIRKIQISYNLFKILKKEWDLAFNKLIISNITCSISPSDIDFIFSSNKSESEKTNDKKTSARKIDTETIKNYVFALPFDVQLKNINFEYKQNKNLYSISLRSLNLGKGFRNQSLSIDLQGVLFAKFSDFSVGTRIQIDGNVFKDFEGSFLKFEFNDYPRANISLKKNESYLRFLNDELTFNSIQQILPYNTYLSLNTKTSDLNFNFIANELNPLSLFKISKASSVLNKVKGTTFTSDTEFKINLKDFSYSWKSDDKIVLSKKLVPDGQMFSLNALGNNSFMEIKSLSAKGSVADFDSELFFDIKKMQPSGVLSLNHFVLKNGNKMSADVYCEPYEKGFMCFIPQLYLGTQSFTAIQFIVDELSNSMGFSFDLSDYTHSDYETVANIHLDGNLNLGKNTYLESSISVDSFFLDSIMRSVSFFTSKDGNQETGLVKALAPYISSTELYFSTDFKSVTFNSPYSVFANTQENRQMMVLSFNGSESVVSITNLDLIFGDMSLLAKFSADLMLDEKQIIFTSDLSFNSIPYQLNGIYSLGEWLNLTGNYGLDLTIDFREDLEGSLQFASCPISFNQLIVSTSLDSRFKFKSIEDFNLEIDNFLFEEITDTLRTKPKFKAKGEISPKGLLFSDLILSDNNFVMSGSSYVLLNKNDDVFDSVNLFFDIKNDHGKEAIKIEGSLTNPLKKKIGADLIKNDCYFSLVADIKSFPMDFFLSGQAKDNTISAVINGSGTFENPYLSLSVPNVSMTFAGSPLIASCNTSLLEGDLKIDSLACKWGNFKVDDFSASADLNNFQGSADFVLNASILENYIKAPCTMKIINLDLKKSSFLPESFAIELDSPKIESNAFKKLVPLHVKVLRSHGRWDLMTDEKLGLIGEYLDEGIVNLSVDSSKPITFNLSGSIKNQIMDFTLKEIDIDASYFANLINNDFFSLYKGIAKGELTISGLITDPNINGSVVVKNFDINVPLFVPEHLFSQEVVVQFRQNELVIDETPFKVKDGRVLANAYLTLDRWTMNSCGLYIKSVKNKDVPCFVKVPFVSVKGYTDVDMFLGFADGVFDVKGKYNLRNAEVSLLTNLDSRMMPDPNAPGMGFDVRVAVDVNVGQKVQVLMNPVLRGLVTPNTPLSFMLDTSNGLWSLKSDIVLRGGEVFYLSRNFYLKEGRVLLNESQNAFDPTITVRAETREHDEDGDPVIIILSAQNQKLSSFNASLTSTPAKSETEIMSLLGQILTGDSDSMGKFITSVADYGVQTFVLRKIESALRDFCNFDIFSIRTTFIQNTLEQGFNLNRDSNTNMLISNLFDNSTVYIGKYFGSTVYADALMHWVYDEAKASAADTTGGLVFQPEIGLELEAPFANIRWSLAPDLSELNQSIVSAASITLSWRLSF